MVSTLNWQAITAGAELIGIVVLILSVIYLSKQIRHTNLQSVSEALKDSTQLYLAQYEKSFGTEEKTAFMRKALNDYTSLSQDEKGRLFTVVVGYVAAWDNLHTKYENGFLLEETYNSFSVAFASRVQTSGGRASIEQLHKEFALPPYIMSNTTVEEIAGIKIKPYVDCLDFLKNEQIGSG